MRSLRPTKMRFMREHRWTHSHLSAYLDSELEQGERERIEEHVGLCPDCRRVLATLRRAISSLRAIGDADAGRPGSGTSDVSEGVLARLRREG